MIATGQSNGRITACYYEGLEEVLVSTSMLCIGIKCIKNHIIIPYPITSLGFEFIPYAKGIESLLSHRGQNTKEYLVISMHSRLGKSWHALDVCTLCYMGGN